MSQTRAFLATVSTLAFFLFCSMPPTAWAEGAENDKASTSKPDGVAAEAPKGAGEPPAPAAVEHELSELKEE